MSLSVRSEAPNATACLSIRRNAMYDKAQPVNITVNIADRYDLTTQSATIALLSLMYYYLCTAIIEIGTIIVARYFERTTAESIQKVLKQLPERKPTRMNARAVVQFLADDIRDAMNRGYSIQDITELLHDNGMEMSTSTIRSNLPNRKQPDRAAKRPRKTKTAGVASTASMERDHVRVHKPTSRAKNVVVRDTEDL